MRGGKTWAMEKAIAAYLKENPKATIVRVTPEGIRVEKYVGSSGPSKVSHENNQTS